MVSMQMSSNFESNAVIGIIYPPPEVRHIVDRTALFVAKNGLEFESRLRQREQANPRFNFLNVNDPYNEYYKYRIRESMSSSGTDDNKNSGKGSGSEPIRFTTSELLPPKNPLPEPEFIADPSTFQEIDIEIIQLTALFVAANGRKFLMNLINREQKNYQFDFLRPQHSNFTYFTKMVDQYSKILLPTNSMIKEMNDELSQPKTVMDKVRHLMDWYKYQDRAKKREEEMVERERLSYAQIDWHDFVIVDTIDFRPSDKGILPPPTTPDEVGARLLQQERLEKRSFVSATPVRTQSTNRQNNQRSKNFKPPQPVSTIQEEDEVQMVDATKIIDEPTIEELANNLSDGIDHMQASNKSDTDQNADSSKETFIIRKDYDPKENKTDSNVSYLVSPFTQEKIPSANIPQHMRIGLLGPSWKEQREKNLEERKEHQEVYVSGDAMNKSLKSIAERRSDIFGEGDVETEIGKKVGGGENDKPANIIIWDGHSSSLQRVTQKARENITIEDQIEELHRRTGFAKDEEKERIGPVPLNSINSDPPAKKPRLN